MSRPRTGSRGHVIVAACLCLPLLGACAHLPSGCDTWLCRDAVYFVGDPERIEALPAPDAGMGVALARFDDVDVLRRQGDRVKFRRGIPYHTALVGWAPADAFVRHSDFLAQTAWPRVETFEFCHPGGDCQRMRISGDARYTLIRTRARFHDVCALRPHARPFAGECAISGTLRVARGYVMVSHPEGHLEFFTVDAAGAWCHVRSKDLYGQCLPTSNALIDRHTGATLMPASPPSPPSDL